MDGYRFAHGDIAGHNVRGEVISEACAAIVTDTVEIKNQAAYRGMSDCLPYQKAGHAQVSRGIASSHQIVARNIIPRAEYDGCQSAALISGLIYSPTIVLKASLYKPRAYIDIQSIVFASKFNALKVESDKFCRIIANGNGVAFARPSDKITSLVTKIFLEHINKLRVNFIVELDRGAKACTLESDHILHVAVTFKKLSRGRRQFAKQFLG